MVPRVVGERARLLIERGSAWRTGSLEDEPMAERGGQLAAKLANNRKNAKYGEKMI